MDSRVYISINDAPKILYNTGTQKVVCMWIALPYLYLFCLVEHDSEFRKAPSVFSSEQNTQKSSRTPVSFWKIDILLILCLLVYLYIHMTDSISNHAMGSAWGCQNILAWKYAILHSKWRNTCFTVWLKKILFRNGELLTLQFHKNCQNIFQNNAVFFTKYTYLVGFSFMWWEIFSSIEWSEKNIKIFEIEKIAAVFLKTLKMDFLEKVTLIMFYFFSVDCR